MNNLADAVLTYLINIMAPYFLVLPSFIIVIAVWRVARMRGLTWDNYRELVNENAAETVKEQLSARFLQPLLAQEGVQLPRGTHPSDLLERLVQDDPNNLQLLTTIYESLGSLGAQSPYFQQILVFLGG